MKKLFIILLLIGLLSGCGNTEKPVEITGEVVADVPAAELVAETPKEDIKTYEFSILEKEASIEEICTVTSRIKNLDVVAHRYRINSYVIINGVKEERGEEFNLEPGKIRTIIRDIKCLLGTEDTLNAEGFEIR